MKRNWIAGLIGFIVFTSLLAGCTAGKSNAPSASSAATATASALATAATATAAPADNANQVKLSVFNGTVEAVDWLNAEIKTFNEQNPGIKAEQEFQKSATDVLKVKVASGDTPDIVALADVPQEFFDQDLFIDFANDPIWNRMSDPVGIKAGVADTKRPDKNFTVPMTLTFTGVYYDKKIISDLGITRPDTWEQFTADLQKVKTQKPDITPLYLGGKDGWTLGQLVQFYPLGGVQQKLGVLAADKAFSTNDPSLAFDQVGGMQDIFAKNIMSLQANGLINKNAVSAPYDSQLDAIANGKAAFVIQGMWALSDILKKNPQADLGFWPLPTMYAGTKPYMIGAPDGKMAISAKSPHQAEAKKFMDFLLSPQVQISYSKLRNSPSVYKDAPADWSMLSKDIAADQQIAFVATRWPFTNSGYNGDAMGKTMQDLLVGAFKTSADYAKTFKEDWDKGVLPAAQ